MENFDQAMLYETPSRVDSQSDKPIQFFSTKLLYSKHCHFNFWTVGVPKVFTAAADGLASYLYRIASVSCDVDYRQEHTAFQ